MPSGRIGAVEQFFGIFCIQRPADFWRVFYHHLNKFHHWIKIGPVTNFIAPHPLYKTIY
jgi:hypothetical protein